MRTHVLASSALVATLLLAGCAPADQAQDHPSDPEAPSAATDDTLPAPDFEASVALAAITSCDQVEGLVAPYIGGLVPLESNVVDEWGVMCDWGMAEDETDFANNRSVSVHLAPVEKGTEKPDPTALSGMDGFAVIEDAWVAERGGVASTYSQSVAVAGATVTTVWFPSVEASVSGGTWADMPSLDGPAALEVIKRLLPGV